MGVQHRLAAHFRRLADEAEERGTFEVWAAYVEALTDDDEHVRAFARAQHELGDPAEFTPFCDDGLHLRLLGDTAPSAHGLEYIASLEGLPESWVYVDWARQGPAPTRDGVPQWTVRVDVMVRGDAWEWPPTIDHPAAERLTSYGWVEVWPTYEEHHLRARLAL